MGEIGRYLYGIINSNTKKFFGCGGIGTREEVYTIPYQDISALVSDSEVVDYTRMPKDNLARQLVRHQKVIERVMTLHPIIPMRLGTFSPDEDEVRVILSKGYSLIKEIFSKIGDRIEIDLVAVWSDFDSLLKEIGEEKEIMEFKEDLLGSPEGITVDDQMKAGIMIKKALDEKRGRYALEIQRCLSKFSEDIRLHELMNDRMAATLALLINKADQEDFDRKIEELNNKFSEKLNFRCVGPLPPYSFYTLEARKILFEEVDWAAKKLGLNEFATKEEIKKAYQRQAFSFHPDNNPNRPGMEKEFDELNRAYKIVIDYCKACEQEGKEDNFSFNKEEFKKNEILVRARD